MRWKLLFLTLLVPLLFGCASWRRDWGWCLVDYSKDYETGSLRKTGQYERFSLNQENGWTFYYKSGEKRAAGDYYMDFQDGQWTYWYPEGTKKLEGPYVDQRRTGVWAYYYSSGGLHARGRLYEGLDHGAWTYWNENGSLDRRGHYEMGQQIHRWTYWHPDGRVKAQGYYFQGRKVGPWIFVRSGGQVASKTYPLPDGVELVRECWPDEDTPRREGFLKGGEFHGRWVTRHRNGQTRFEGDFELGVATGQWTAWREDGQPLAWGAVEDGRPSGEWTVWVDGSARALEADWISHPGPGTGPWSPATLIDQLGADDVVMTWLGEAGAPIDPSLECPVRVPARATSPSASQEQETEIEPELDDEGEPALTLDQIDRQRRMMGRNRNPYVTRRRRPATGGGPGSYQISSGANSRGDLSLSEPLLGKPLAVTKFHTPELKSVDLENYRGKKNVLLVILRGLDSRVCEYCLAQTEALRYYKDELARLSTEVFVVYPGPRRSLGLFVIRYREAFGENPPNYTMLYDADLAVSARLNIVEEYAKPTTLLIDKQGIVRFAYVGKRKDDRPAFDDVIKKIESLP